MQLKDKFIGCMLGGAVGDALGSPIEFWSVDAIHAKFGNVGIQRFELIDDVALISDDTQMTLFTVNGILICLAREGRDALKHCVKYIYQAYQEWLMTQKSLEIVPGDTWIRNLPELNESRAPGNTCLEALEKGVPGSIQTPINRSKGCGGVMRVAPIGLLGGSFETDIELLDMLGAESAALTHGHPLGYIPAAALVHIVNKLAYNGESGDISFESIISDCNETLRRLFKDDITAVNDMSNLLELALDLSADKHCSDLEAIEILGKGWVAEEALAIALFCCAKYRYDFDKAVITSVNHGGDSDSTGAIAGNIMGALLGAKSIPRYFLNHLELVKTIYEMADDYYNLCNRTHPCPNKSILKKYVG